MLSGKVPFPGNSELEIIGNVIKGDFHFNHEPFKRHSPEAKEFLQCLIKKDVSQRLSAIEALNHDWINKNSIHQTTSLSEESINDMKKTYDLIRLRRTTLVYLSEECPPNNIRCLSELCKEADP